MTAMASHMPRTKVRRPLTTRMPVTWGSRTTATVSRATSRMPTAAVGRAGWGAIPRNRTVRAAAPKKIAALPAKTTAGVVATSRNPPSTAPRAWLKVFTVLMPAADAASSLGVRASAGTNAACTGR